jgi:hypothetical protein
MPPPRAREITSDLLIVGEGAGDAALIRYLAAVRGINGFQVEDAGGNSKFQPFMAGLPGLRGFDKLKGLIVVADTDSGADDSFRSIQKQMKAAKIVCAHAPYKVANPPNADYATYVLMLPFVDDGVDIIAQTGALETMLLPSAEAHLNSHIDCLNAWCACVQMDALSKTHRDKARLRSLIAAAYPEDPNIGLQYALSPSKNLIPLNHQCFDALEALLRSLPEKFNV